VVIFDGAEFGAFGQSRAARSLWKFLNQPDQVVRLEVASELGHAALDGVVVDLERKFHKSLRNKRTKQMVGAMIKRVLESRGWRVGKKGVRVRLGRRFSVAVRYHKPQR
jgi:hypothetical protein